MAAYTTIDDPEAYFQTVIWTGNGAANHAITLPGDTDMQPDLVWIKNRDANDSHCLFDSVRGATKLMHIDLQGQETTDADTLDSFTSDGFQVDADVKVNTDTEKYVAWCWKESATAGFDMVTWTGNGSARDISHSLSALPHWIIIKAVDRDGPDWITFGDKIHATPHDAMIKPNNTIAISTGLNSSWFNDTNPTTSVFTIGTQGDLNADGSTYIAYLWTSIQGFIKFDSYTGNGDADGPFIFTGFRPAFVLIKNYGRASTSWTLYDNKRPGYNSDNAYLLTDANDVEASDKDIDLFSNGFKPLLSNNAVNTSGDTYIYMAIAEAPFVNSEGVPCNAR